MKKPKNLVTKGIVTGLIASLALVVPVSANSMGSLDNNVCFAAVLSSDTSQEAVVDEYSELTTEDITLVDDEGEGEEYLSEEVVIRFKDGTSQRKAKKALDAFGLSMDSETLADCLSSGVVGVATIEDSSDTVSRTLSEIKADGESCIAYAQANYIYEVFEDVEETPEAEETDEESGDAGEINTTEINDELAGSLWHLNSINAYDAWDIQKTEGSVAVAVIDTGVDADHEDLEGRLVAGYNSVDGSTDFDDINGHGTHVAGIIASEVNNEIGTAGVSYNANIIPVMAAYDAGGYFSTSDLAKAYEYLLADEDGNGIADLVEEYNLHVVNMSLGSLTTVLSSDNVLLSAVDAAYEQNIMTVCAAGNNGTSSYLTFPADYETCFSVIALNESLAKASYSNYGAAKDIAAPGSNIYSTYWGNTYKKLSGTSMASPVVAGVAALVFATDSSLTVDDVKAALVNSAQDLGDEGFDNETANGCVDALAALEILQESYTVTFDGGEHATVSDGENTGRTLCETVTFAGTLGATYTFIAEEGYTISGYSTEDGTIYETLEDIVTMDTHITGDLTITPVCIPDDEAVTAISLGLTNADCLQPTLYVTGDEVTIDWGDGEVSTGTGAITKGSSYAAVGSYVVTVTSDGEYLLGGGASDSAILSGDYTPYLKKVVAGENAGVQSYTFCDCTGLTSVDLSHAGTAASSLIRLFSGCTSLKSVDLNGLDTSNVENMSYMFYNCTSLAGLDLSALDTQNNTSMAYMFYNCSSLTELDVTSLDTSSVTNMCGAFSSMGNIKELDVSHFDTSNVTDMSYMFYYCDDLTSLDVSNFDTSSVTDMSYAFAYLYSAGTIDVAGIDTSNVTDMSFMFARDYGLTSLDVSTIDTSSAVSLYGMFYDDYTVPELDISGFDTSNVENMDCMFFYCEGVSELDFSNFDTTNVTTMDSFLCGCYKLESLDLSSFELPNLTNMSYSFAYCYGLKTIDLSSFGQTQVTDLSGTFYFDRGLEEVIWGSFGTGEVTTASYMFFGCSQLQEIELSNITTASTFRIDHMFSNCRSLKTIDLSCLDLSDIYYLESGSMVYGGTYGVLSRCDSLETCIYPAGASLATELPSVAGYSWYDEDEEVCTEAAADLEEDMTYTRIMDQIELTEEMFTVDTEDEAYTGYGITKEIATDLVEGTDYTVAYTDNVNAGTASLTITGMGNYTGSLTYTFTINKAVYDMSGVSFEDAVYTYDGTEKSLTVSGSLPAGVSVSYTDNTLINAGAVEVVASFTGDADNYEPIEDMTATLTISEAAFGATDLVETNYTGAYDGNAHVATVTATGAAEGATVTYSTREDGEYTSTAPSFTDAGSYTVYYKVTKENYQEASGTLSIEIGKAAYDMSGVTFSDTTYTYDGSEKVLEISGDLPEGVNVSYESNTRINVGSVSATAHFTGDEANYEAIPDMEATLTITTAVFDNMSVTAEGYSGTYDGEAHTVSITLSGAATGASVTYSTSEDGEYTSTAPVFTDAGTYNVYYKVSKANYEDQAGELTVEIAKAAYDMSGVSFADASYVYDGTGKSLVITGELPEGVSVSYENNTLTNAGTAAATAHFTGDTANYEAIPDMAATLTITACPVSASMFSISMDAEEYNGTAITKEVISSLAEGRDYTVSYQNNTNAGTALVAVTGIGNYEGTVSFTFEIAPRDVEIVIDDQEKAYGTDDPEFTGTLTGLVNDNDLGAVSYTRTEGEEPGTYAITCSYTENSNYAVTVTEGTLTITTRELSEDLFIVDTSNETYCGEAITKQITTSLTEGTDYTVAYAGNVDAGTTSLTITGMGNYTGTVSYTFTISPCPVEIFVRNAEKSYGEADPEFSGTVSGLVNESDLGEITYSRTEGEDVGSYTISASYTENSNYAVLVHEGTLKITAASLTSDMFNVDTADEKYTGKAITKQITSSLKEGTDYTVSYSNNTNQGTATITITGKGNYTGTLTYQFKIVSSPSSGSSIISTIVKVIGSLIGKLFHW